MNCVTTGKPATLWTGHVRAEAFSEVLQSFSCKIVPVMITAGHASRREMQANRSCYYGEWKREHGLMLDHGGAWVTAQWSDNRVKDVVRAAVAVERERSAGEIAKLKAERDAADEGYRLIGDKVRKECKAAMREQLERTHKLPDRHRILVALQALRVAASYVDTGNGYVAKTDDLAALESFVSNACRLANDVSEELLGYPEDRFSKSGVEVEAVHSQLKLFEHAH